MSKYKRPKQPITWNDLEDVIAAIKNRLPEDGMEAADPELYGARNGLLRTYGILMLLSKEEVDYYFSSSEFTDAVGACVPWYGCWLDEVRQAIETADLSFLEEDAEPGRQKMLSIHQVACLWMLDLRWGERRAKAATSCQTD